MNLVSLEYFLTNKTKNKDLNALLSEKIETIFSAMTRYSLLYLLTKKSFPSRGKSLNDMRVDKILEGAVGIQ